MLAAWRRARINRGSRVLDIGAGPGFATADLAEIVGAAGQVLGLERSARFVIAGQERAVARGLAQMRIEEVDIMADAIPATGFDAAWCRWVACFVSSPGILVQRIAHALRPGGVAVFHEYGNYASWRFLPPRPAIDRFVAAVMASWRDTGGEPDVGLVLPELLQEHGFRVRHVRPLAFAVRPSDFVWQWPATFLRSGANRLRELDRLAASELAAAVEAFDQAERDPSTFMMTPLVLEIIADKCRQ